METNCERKAVDLGLLILRLGIGVAFIIHGYPKLMAGPEGWAGLGSNMAVFGITYKPVFWGFMAAFSEGVGGLLLVIGCCVRLAAFLMLITMVVATTMHINNGGDFSVYSHSLELGIVFLALFFAGSGKYTLGSCFKADKESKEE